MADNIKEKDPNAKLDYAFRWHDWLSPFGDSINSYVITISPSAISGGLVNEGDTTSSGCVVVWLSGGTPRSQYSVACKITTAQGRIDERTMIMNIREK